ncbi:MAG: gluconokinase [Rhodospirillales bacterium]|nr:gluconokinase [Rhodospirillales bacterium]
MLNQCILIMGISGSGKTTTGKLLANKIGGDFLDADDLHPRCNIQKIKNGYSLTDQDRAPWLEEIISAITNHHRQQILVIACSALKKSYREKIGRQNYTLVFLDGSKTQISERLASRENHFMPQTLLKSQFNDLEKPSTALNISISDTPDEIVRIIIRELGIFDVQRN